MYFLIIFTLFIFTQNDVYAKQCADEIRIDLLMKFPGQNLEGEVITQNQYIIIA